MQKLQNIGGVSAYVRSFVTSSLHRNADVKQTANLVVTDKFKAVTILSINRPDKQNALNQAVLHELASQLTQFEEDNNASIAILTGIGGNFSAGYDIDELKKKSEHDINSIRSSLVFPFKRRTTKPLLCSISGLCKSIGFEIALMCDIRYAEEKALFGFNNRLMGIPLLNDGPKRLAKLIGLPKATELLVLDRQITSSEAVDLGIVNAVVQDGTALGTALKRAVFFSSLAQSALQHDLSNLNGLKFDYNKWPSILNDIKSNITLSDESLKSVRVSKLNNMPEWELEEIQHEKNYAKNNRTVVNEKNKI